MRKKILLLTIVSFLLSGCADITDEETKIVSSACEKFIMEEMGGNYKVETNVFDAYKKRGKLVAEVGYRDKYSRRNESYSVRLCILDEQKGTISSPSPLDDSEWVK